MTGEYTDKTDGTEVVQADAVVPYLADGAELIDLTDENYYTPPANNITRGGYMGHHQMKAFVRCPAAWLAEYVLGEWKSPATEALAVGALAHSAALTPEENDAVLEEYADILTTKSGAMGAKARQAVALGTLVREKPELTEYVEGSYEEIVTGTIGGIPWKGKLDIVNHDRRTFTDLKFVRNAHGTEYIERLRCRGSFVFAFDYDLQMAIYQELLWQQYGEVYTPYIIAIGKPTTKRPTPDIVVYPFDAAAAFERRLEETVDRVATMLYALRGSSPFARCEGDECDYCARTRTDFLAPALMEPVRLTL